MKVLKSWTMRTAVFDAYSWGIKDWYSRSKANIDPGSYLKGLGHGPFRELVGVQQIPKTMVKEQAWSHVVYTLLNVYISKCKSSPVSSNMIDSHLNVKSSIQSICRIHPLTYLSIYLSIIVNHYQSFPIIIIVIANHS